MVNPWLNIGCIKDYAQSDRIREQLQQMGITLIDRPLGETSIVYS